MFDAVATGFDDAPQHGPRPLPLFLDMLARETAGAPDRTAAALAGLHAYQTAKRLKAVALPRARHQRGRARLRDYSTGHGTGAPIVFVPSLINPPTILDLAPDRSLLRWMAARGHRTLLVDWGMPGEADRDIDIGGHVERLLLPMLRRLSAPPVLVGYCLGGTIALAAASAMPVGGVATIAAPWHFTGYGAQARADIARLWTSAAPACAAIGVVPVEVLQAGFWQLDPARTIAKYAAFAAMTPGSPEAHAFVRLEDWANSGAPLPYAAGRQLFERFVGQDDPGGAGWTVGGIPIDPAALSCPSIAFASRTDRIVPAATTPTLDARHDLSIGHVGMIVGGKAHDQLWMPLAHWIETLSPPR
ncbi:poly-beta-hydroxybutyrate polymerase [Sphingomonas sp. Leaf17]|uniref:alpha/beta hydrolase n=1 Tax=Sphingomonas sp. Leaf17 TaxID=1735683 RepID=UPI0006FFD6C4|nr:alpha/beta hydrolase [Sphingomonas sp. Leaf17]KQM63214.1 poly-beta-hydroxybutyrate polymerase [Sphingomonas sp. Leaf17]